VSQLALTGLHKAPVNLSPSRPPVSIKAAVATVNAGANSLACPAPDFITTPRRPGMALPAFQYAPLDLAGDGLRLIYLLRGHPPDPVDCRILETCLREVDCIPYEALSYCWGSSGKTSAIILDSCHKPVTDNLFAALKHLRSPGSDRILWIDAICIDQDNKKEQGHQVAQMKRIYENAEGVVVWLGEGTEDTDFLMAFMGVLQESDHADRITSVMEDYDTPRHRLRIMWLFVRNLLKLTAGEYRDEICDNLASTLSNLLRRPWFRRVWVIQEVACARSVLLSCGSRAIYSRTFFDVASLLGVIVDSQANSQVRALLDVMPGPRRKGSWWSESRDLWTLLHKFQTSEATDERDRVYALLGISSDASLGNALSPDYEKPMREVVRTTISFLLWGEPVDFHIYPLPFWTLDQVLHGEAGSGERRHDPLTCRVFRWACENKVNSTALLLLERNKRMNPILSPVEYYYCLSDASGAEDGQLITALLAYEHDPRRLFDSLMIRLGEDDAPPSFKLLCFERHKQQNHEHTPKVWCFSIEQGRDALMIAQAQREMRQAEGWTEPNPQKLGSFLCGILASEPQNFNAEVVRSLVRQGADINFRGNVGRTPFFEAVATLVRSDRREYIRPDAIWTLLLELGADPHTEDDSGQTIDSLLYRGTLHYVWWKIQSTHRLQAKKGV
jgi:hypothetical protein